MAADMKDDVYYVVSGRVTDSGAVDLKLPMRRFPRVLNEKRYYRLAIVDKRGELPKGFESKSFLKEHFLSGADYVETTFARPIVNLDILIIARAMKRLGKTK